MKDDAVSLIKERLDIVEVIGDSVRLKKAGKSWTGLCPFHNEKTPSFHVSQERQNFHCFGCKKGGDIFTFVMETEGLNFQEALEFLARRAGLDIEKYQKSGGKKVSSSAYDVLEFANSFFRQNFASSEANVARAYIDRRKLPKEAIEKFELGWSPLSWDALTKFLNGKNISSAEAVELGLAIDGQRGAFDRFRGRVMFPIRDVSGRLVAFGGRIIDGEGVKYMNSPESQLYRKRSNLYLLNVAKTAIKEKNRVILVEGYLDAIRLHLCGYHETVGSLGTALTEQQAVLIKRFTDSCYLCYDSDTAGQDATLRGMYVLQKMGLDVRIISLPRGKDPDALLSEGSEGLEAFSKAVSEALPLVLQHLKSARALFRESRKRGEEFLFDGLTQLEDSDISPYANRLAGELDLSVPQFWNALDKSRKSAKSTSRVREENGESLEIEDEPVQIEPLEAALCSLLWYEGDIRERCAASDVLPFLSEPKLKQLAFAILNESPNQLDTRWHSMGETFPMQVLAQGASFCDRLANVDKWQTITDELRRKRDKARYSELRSKMRLGKASEEEMSEMNSLAAWIKGKR